ncbi:major facilitator superfamily domain-containing protein [Aspergillus pseudotamarii]|uniref:Major facilitator superfamily domain-containing protein n=1 Tax=Aspergillus pseudotamarii TaxID=132259 RepID=A0A5N6SZY9_ASPPS|nr:major facilitator superfamily domain-containing protein [Aspergillus pseudotamarii]KAE8139013.1 major facilitator superfamily domain-containing protein [Aspergillus pseudotamarii]
MVAQTDAVGCRDSAPEERGGTKPSYQVISEDSDRHPNGHGHDEESALLSSPTANDERKVELSTSISTIVAVLLLGEFISNADSTLVMAATAKVSSEFNQLQDASWLSTGYTLGYSVVVHSSANDWLFRGIGRDLWTVIVGRAVSGIGGAGIMTLGSVIITDIVPRREVASWRAYINIAMTLGRSVGGPVGGWLTDAIGWRWLFLLQIPFIVLGGLLVIAKLNITYHATSKASIRRVDFLGAGLLGASVVAIIMLLDRGGHAFPWISLLSFVLGGTGIALLVLFVWAERVAAEPIFDLRILARPNVASSYMVGFLQITSQLGMLFSVPLYFQVSQRASATVAGGHLVPAVVGNTVGGLLAGTFIRRTGRYKALLVIGGLVAAITHVLMLIRWNGHTNFGESLYIIPGGIGTGIASASAFVAMTALLEPQDMAMATGGYMLIVSFAMTTGITMTNTVLGLGFKHQLEQNLHGKEANKIIRRATSDTNYIAKLEGKIWEIVVGCFVAGLKNTYGICLVFSILGSLVALTIRHHHL